MLHPTRRILTRVGVLANRPDAFGIVTVYAIAWLFFSPQTFGWAAVASLATWMMTLFITRTQHRDTQAMHAKLDELLRAHDEAKTELGRLDEQDVEEIEAHRSKTRPGTSVMTPSSERRKYLLSIHLQYMGTDVNGTERQFQTVASASAILCILERTLKSGSENCQHSRRQQLLGGKS